MPGHTHVVTPQSLSIGWSRTHQLSQSSWSHPPMINLLQGQPTYRTLEWIDPAGKPPNQGFWVVFGLWRKWWKWIDPTSSSHVSYPNHLLTAFPMRQFPPSDHSHDQRTPETKRSSSPPQPRSNGAVRFSKIWWEKLQGILLYYNYCSSMTPIVLLMIVTVIYDNNSYC